MDQTALTGQWWSLLQKHKKLTEPSSEVLRNSKTQPNPIWVLTFNYDVKDQDSEKSTCCNHRHRRKKKELKGDLNISRLADKMTSCEQTWWMMLFMLLLLLCPPATWLPPVKAIPVSTVTWEGPAPVRHQVGTLFTAVVTGWWNSTSWLSECI